MRVELGLRSYEIAIGQGTISGLGDAVRASGRYSARCLLVSNPTVYALYGKAASDSLRAAGFDVHEVIIPDGEEYKSMLWVEHMLTEMLAMRLDRGSVLVALGGGVIGDMAGFAAALYMRGMAFVQVPTTLLSQVDSSVGGKTGVNHPLGKNMIGAFWQPSLVWMDVDTLRTLPRRELMAGMAEVIKYGVIWDAKFFDYLIDKRDTIMSLDPAAITHIIRRSCEIKAEVVSKDEREGGIRAILNYGHTIGHAVETLTGYTKHLHGEGVAIGMYMEALLAENVGVAPKGVADKIGGILDAYELPKMMPDGLKPEAVLDAMMIDKKTLSGQLRFILPESIGKCRVNAPVSAEKVKEFLISK